MGQGIWILEVAFVSILLLTYFCIHVRELA
jgi:hypothetical protein